MTTLTDTQVVTASGGLVELGYTTYFSATVGGGSWTSIASTTVVSDGSKLLVEFQCPFVTAAAQGRIVVNGSSTYRFGDLTSSGSYSQSLVITPTPAAGSVTIDAQFTSFTSATITGSVGTYALGSAFLRVSKIVSATQWPAVTTGTIICTSTTRPASPFEGQTIYETDTDLEQRWTGSAWVVSGSNGGSFLSASSTTTVSAASTITYTQASITLTPGVWEVTSAMTLINGTTTDSAAVAIYNQTAAAVVSGSYGTPGYTSTTWAAALQSMPTKMTVTSNTQVCPYGNRNGGSTIAPASGVGAPVGLITARRLYGG